MVTGHAPVTIYKPCMVFARESDEGWHDRESRFFCKYYASIDKDCRELLRGGCKTAGRTDMNKIFGQDTFSFGL